MSRRPTHQFSQTKTATIPRSSFDLSHGYKTTLDAGFLIPILSLECLPGDTINCRASLFGRLATPIKPILDNLHLETFFFFTPTRQVWPNFVKMMGEQVNPTDSIDFSVPVVGTGAAVTTGTLGDYYGIPLGTDPDDVVINALPFRIYGHIYNFWFRDENLIPSLNNASGDGPDAATQTLGRLPQRRRKRRDYITAGLPFQQKGPDVTVSLGTSAPIATAAVAGQNIEIINGAGNPFTMDTLTTGELAPLSTGAGVNTMFADLSASNGISIQDLRESTQIQKLLERDARGGTRYPEILRSHFQVTDPSLLVHQRPLYLGGGKSMINITPVQQTTESDALTPQGNLAAYGTVSAAGHGFTSSFTEHGYITGLVNVRADLTYQQGLERYWSRQTRYDFFWPTLAHLSEQDVKNKEVFVSNSSVDDEVFAYMPRYDEYRFKQSQITGLFRSDAAASLDVWHLAQDFQVLPALNKAFIEDNPPIDRVVAVPSEPDLLLDVYFKITAARPLPTYATPGMGGTL
nr:MAG: major capsid protein [Microvirus sp.]